MLNPHPLPGTQAGGKEGKAMRYTIKLTDEQCKRLQPIVDEIENDPIGEDGVSGSSVLQYMYEKGTIEGMYLPMAWAKKVVAIIKDYEKFNSRNLMKRLDS